MALRYPFIIVKPLEASLRYPFISVKPIKASLFLFDEQNMKMGMIDMFHKDGQCVYNTGSHKKL